MGTIHRAYIAYAGDENVRRNAASGGAVTALLLHLLAKRRIQGAVVVGIDCTGGRIDARVKLATTAREILSAQTSKYTDAPVVREGLRLIRGFSGDVAVVALPCHTTAFRRLAEREPEIASRIKYIITLFCNHSCERYLLEKVLEANGIDKSQVVDFSFRRGRWRGRMCGRLRDGSEFSFPFRRFSYYHNLHMFSLPRCLHCHDHMGYLSDFSAGDAWLREMKSHPIKHSIIFSRNPRATKVLEEMTDKGELVGKTIDRATVFRSQKRSLIYHYNVSARAQAARAYGMRIEDTVNAEVRWNDALAARMIMMNHHWSHNRRTRDWIFKIPRPIIAAYFLLLKLLQNF